MNTFFISPTDPEASIVYSEIADMPLNTWISPRGEEINECVNCQVSVYDTDPESPKARNPGLIHTYITAQEWLDEYHINNPNSPKHINSTKQKLRSKNLDLTEAQFDLLFYEAVDMLEQHITIDWYQIEDFAENQISDNFYHLLVFVESFIRNKK